MTGAPPIGVIIKGAFATPEGGATTRIVLVKTEDGNATTLRYVDCDDMVVPGRLLHWTIPATFEIREFLRAGS